MRVAKRFLLKENEKYAERKNYKPFYYIEFQKNYKFFFVKHKKIVIRHSHYLILFILLRVYILT